MKCIICGGDHNLVNIRKIINMNLDFIEGLTYTAITESIIYCEACFMKYIWYKENDNIVI